MAMLDLGTLKIGISVDTQDAKKGFEDVKKQSKETGESIKTDWSKVASNLSSVGSSLTKALTLPILAAAGAAVKLASDMEETINKIDVVFNDNAETVKDWSSTSIKSMGLAQQTALEAASVFGDMGSGMGLTSNEASNMSMQLVQLSADLASFKNISIDRANTALQGVYTGETEALKGLGIVMTEANLEQYAMNIGVKTSYKEMTQAQKVMLRYNYVMNTTANAQGDFARTSDSLANQSRMAKEGFKELGVQFGNVLLPIINKVVGGINNLLSSLMLLSPEQRETAVTIALIVAAIGPLLLTVAKVITAITTIKEAIIAANLQMNATAGIIALVVAAVSLLIGIFAAQKAAQEELDKQTREEHHKALDETIAKYKQVADEQIATSETTQSLTDKLIEMAATDPNIDIQSNADAVKPSIENLQTAIGNLLTDTDDLSDSIDGVNTALSDYVTNLAEARRQTTIEHIMNLTQAYRDGSITQQQFNQYVNESVDGYKNYEAAIQGTTTAFDTFIDGFNGDGKLTLEQTNALLYGSNAIAANGTSIGLQLTSAADGMAKLQQATDNGTISQGGYNIIAQETSNILNNEVMSAVDGVANAYSNYDTNVKAANAAEAENRENTQVQLDAYTQKAEYIDFYAKRFEYLGDRTKAFAELETTYGSESVATVKAMLQEKFGSWKVADTEIGIVHEETLSHIRTLEEDLNEDSGYIAQQRKEAIIAAEKQLQSNLGAITTGWTNDQIDDFARLAEQSGFKLDEGFVKMLKSVNDNLTVMQGSFNENGELIPQTFNTAFGSVVDSLKTNATNMADNSYGIGEGVSNGVAKGIKDRQLAAVNAAVDMVKAAIKAAKAAGDIHSPSRKMAAMVGKPLAEGVGVGFDSEVKSVVKRVQVGIGKITTGGSAAVNQKIKETKNNGYSNLIAAIKGITSTGNKSVTQNNTFTSKTLSPYEQQLQIKRLNRDLVGVV